ncbi:hypothetical protein KR222_004031 [Zaprionus bogoriensis]|nr:hypothetical protein KR222_004031 [Zaprionus bogoriensis]
MVRNRKAPNTRTKKKVLLPPGSDYENELCEVLLRSLVSLRSNGRPNLPRRVCERLRNGPNNANNSPRQQRADVGNFRRRGRRRAAGSYHNRQRYNQRSRAMKFRPKCKPLLPNRLVEAFARLAKSGDALSMRPVPSAASPSACACASATAFAPMPTPTSALSLAPTKSERSKTPATCSKFEANMMFLISTQGGVNGALYSWNDGKIDWQPKREYSISSYSSSAPGFARATDMPTLPAPVLDIYDHLRSGLNDICCAPFQQVDSPLDQAPALEEILAAKDVDIYEHVRNMLSQNPVFGQANHI